MRERTETLEEALLMYVPGTRDIPRRHPAGTTVTAELVRALVAVGTVEDIATLVGIGSIGVEGSCTPVRIRQAVVVVSLLDLLLEVLVRIEGGLPSVVLHTPALIRGAITLNIYGLHPPEEVDDVLVVERTVVVRRHTEVIVAQRILRLVEDPPVGQDAHR